MLLNLFAVWNQSFALYHALLLVGFHKREIRCIIHAAMVIGFYVFPDGYACAYGL